MIGEDFPSMGPKARQRAMAVAVKEASGQELRIPGWWFQIFFIFTPYLGKISNLTNIFQMGWNHQPEYIFGMGLHMAKTICNNHSANLSSWNNYW